jgi:hypothetical protein
VVLQGAGEVVAGELAAPGDDRVELLVDAIGDAFERARVYAALAAAAPTAEEANRDAILAIKVIENFVEGSLSVNQQAEIIGARALPYLLTYPSEDALALIASYEDDVLSATALTNIAPRLSPDLVPRAVDIARGYSADARPSPLLALSKTMKEDGVGVLGEALDAALEAGANLFHDRTLSPVVERLLQLPSSDLTPLYRRALETISRQPRPAALASLHALVPILLSVDGDSGARECFSALTDVRQWWP